MLQTFKYTLASSILCTHPNRYYIGEQNMTETVVVWLFYCRVYKMNMFMCYCSYNMHYTIFLVVFIAAQPFHRCYYAVLCERGVCASLAHSHRVSKYLVYVTCLICVNNVLHTHYSYSYSVLCLCMISIHDTQIYFYTFKM